MYCPKCGYKLSDGMKFCPSCGDKCPIINESVTPAATSQLETLTVPRNDISVPVSQGPKYSDLSVQTPKLIRKYFYDEYEYGDQLLVASREEDAGIIEILCKPIESVTRGEPVHMVFNYMNKALEKGFIITDTRFVFWYGTTGINSVLLKDIKIAKPDSSILAKTMRLVYFSNTTSDHIYLTGIINPDAFIARFNDFLFELNQHEAYENQQKKLSGITKSQGEFDGIRAMLDNACRSFQGEYTWCCIGSPIQKHYKKYQAAINNFNLPRTSEIYIIYDETIWGSCKKGFAVCEKGIYFKQTMTRGHMSWEQFICQKLSTGISGFRIGDFIFSTDKKSGTAVLTALQKLQDMFFDMDDNELDTLFERIQDL